MKTVHSPCAESVGTGAPTDEIEITPAMIKAGVCKLLDYDPEFSNETEIVLAIFDIVILARTLARQRVFDDPHQTCNRPL